MDFGAVTGKRATPEGVSSDPFDENRHGSLNSKRERSELAEDAWRVLQPEQPDFSSSKDTENFAAFAGSNLWTSAVDDGQKMLSFSSSESPPAVANVPGGTIEFSAAQNEHYGRTGGVGWGHSNVGYSNSGDPEPGRCRRTDGKKWRCSREAVPDQKYCERHINRGRYRSRKPVESRTAHAITGSTTLKVTPVASSQKASVMSSSSALNRISSIHHQKNPLQPSAADSALDPPARSQGFQPSTTDLKSKSAPFPTQKSNPTYEESPSSEPMDENPVLQFIKDWKKDQTPNVSPSWSEELNADWTQLSMSIPFARHLPLPHDKLPASTPALSPEQYPLHMSLGVNHDSDKPSPKNLFQLPVTWGWGKSMGGPLGEALNCSPPANAGENLLSMKAGKTTGPPSGLPPAAALQKGSVMAVKQLN
ncbi:growth-regulating factor 1-like isoform X2 [Andrographis paniculata]|uniref:growth-regulating factor 1-like isoform X2 n=1 Tax=Andrographis paniculata TaxID=175694 RepID=UPI0021E78CCC|nr:growth-regulating factor 1-like isoform X2 [Andrographis paniculata]